MHICLRRPAPLPSQRHSSRLTHPSMHICLRRPAPLPSQCHSSRLACLCMHYSTCIQSHEILGDYLAFISAMTAFNCVNSRHSSVRAPFSQHPDAYTTAIRAHLSSTFVSQFRVPNIDAYSAPICVRLLALRTVTALVSQFDTFTASIRTYLQSCQRAFMVPTPHRSLLPPAIYGGLTTGHLPPAI